MSSFASFSATALTPTPATLEGRGRASFPSHLRFNPVLPIHKRVKRYQVKCSYAGTSLKNDSGSATIDVTADVKSEKLVVLGGSGFVGSAICKAAVSKGIEVTSLSRSGRPRVSESWVDQVNWIPGDVFYANWDDILVGANAVASTLGGFGNEEQMMRINGDFFPLLFLLNLCLPVTELNAHCTRTSANLPLSSILSLSLFPLPSTQFLQN